MLEKEMDKKQMMQFMFRHLCAYRLYGSLLRPCRYFTLASSDLLINSRPSSTNSPPVFDKNRTKVRNPDS